MTTNWRRELPSLLLLAAMLVLLATTWPVAPDRIPTHWNAAGEVDGWGTRVTGLLLPPLFALGLYLVFLFAPRVDPGRANYASFPDTYLVIRTAVLAVMALFYGIACLSARGVAVSVQVVAPLAVGLLFVVLGSVMGKIRPNWFVGIRTPWTISSKVAWVRTHRPGPPHHQPPLTGRPPRKSSFAIVPMPAARASVAPDAPERRTENVSFGSTLRSPFTTTPTVRVVWPAANVSVPDCAR